MLTLFPPFCSFQTTLSTFVRLARAQLANPDDETAAAALAGHYSRMLSVFPTPDKKATLLAKLGATKDKKVFKFLDTLARPDATPDEVVLPSSNMSFFVVF